MELKRVNNLIFTDECVVDASCFACWERGDSMKYGRELWGVTYQGVRVLVLRGWDNDVQNVFEAIREYHLEVSQKRAEEMERDRQYLRGMGAGRGAAIMGGVASCVGVQETAEKVAQSELDLLAKTEEMLAKPKLSVVPPFPEVLSDREELGAANSKKEIEDEF